MRNSPSWAPRIVGRRRRFLARFSGLLLDAYRLLDAMGEEPTATYAPSVAATPEASGAMGPPEAQASGDRACC